jgi:2-keto-3-deoxy-L-fuconate dehydrogenase
MNRLAGKTAFITAAAAGIGRACALRFAAEGANVIATDINADALAALELESLRIETQVLDVSNAQAIEAAADRHRNVDLLLNIAGWVHHGSILDCDRAAWDRSVSLNLTAMYETCRAFLPAMVARKSGVIVNMSSVASSIKGVPARFAYSATKAGVIGLTKSIAADFVAEGLRCNAICPGTVDTPSLAERMKAGGDYDAARKAFIGRQPMGRLGAPEEIAALAVYLASDEAGFTTGAIHVVDGGWTN